jgi:hypothetical protein
MEVIIELLSTYVRVLVVEILFGTVLLGRLAFM